MTSEQFVFWVSGYLTGGRENDVENVIEDIRNALKQVKVSLDAVVYFTQED